MIEITHEAHGYRIVIYGRLGQQNYTTHVKGIAEVETVQRHIQGLPHKRAECPLCTNKESSQ